MKNLCMLVALFTRSAPHLGRVVSLALLLTVVGCWSEVPLDETPTTQDSEPPTGQAANAGGQPEPWPATAPTDDAATPEVVAANAPPELESGANEPPTTEASLAELPAMESPASDPAQPNLPPLATLSSDELAAKVTNADKLFADALAGAEDTVGENGAADAQPPADDVAATVAAGDEPRVTAAAAARAQDDWPDFLGPPPTPADGLATAESPPSAAASEADELANEPTVAAPTNAFADDSAAMDSAAVDSPAVDTPAVDTVASDRVPTLAELPVPQLPMPQLPVPQLSPTSEPATSELAIGGQAEAGLANDEPREQPPVASPVADVARRAPSVVVDDPVELAPGNTRHAAWLLSSKLSYAMLAGAGADTAEAARDVGELAKLLGVDVPAPTPGAQAADALRHGRAVGEQLATRYGADHAALAEIAVKTNILLAVYEDRPEMLHPIAGATAAAAVRAGIAEPIWQSWQADLLQAEQIDQVRNAVLELQLSIDKLLAAPDDTNPRFR